MITATAIAVAVGTLRLVDVDRPGVRVLGLGVLITTRGVVLPVQAARDKLVPHPLILDWIKNYLSADRPMALQMPIALLFNLS